MTSPRWTLLLALALAAGCGVGEEPQPVTSPKKVTKDKASDDDSAESQSFQAEYIYNPIGKRDPFRAFISDAERDPILDPTPLQRFELEQYQLTGIIWGMDRPRALVEDPEGTGHVIEVGTYIGRKWGKVTRITSDMLVVTEEFLTPGGTLVVNPVEINLSQSEEI